MEQVEGRRVRVAFPASGEARVYSVDAAPLRRVELKVGQTARARDGRTLTVRQVAREHGILTYHGDGQCISEGDLADTLPEGDVLEHLLAAHVGPSGDFDLRRAGWRLRSESLGARTRGLVGARVELLGHQLSVAHRVSRLARPRVLLADEVGLGKTIQAGLIFRKLEVLGRAGRVLLLVPGSLVHQWLAEMYRRFNVMFEVWNEDGDPAVQRRLIAPAWLLEEDPDELDHPWDLVVVDEAHHLVRGAQPDPALKMLAERARGLLLLTATPTRGGLECEFALLHLVDPSRYADLEQFREEQSHLKQVSDLAARLDLAARRAQGMDDDVRERLREVFPGDAGLLRLAETGSAQAVVSALVDRHGTGRALVRNRRERLQGLFPGRALYPAPLDGSDEEARFAWLLEFLGRGPEKALLICARAETVVELQLELRQSLPLKVAVFHEGMTLLERDRQAAYFADPDGARILLASEIGSEGRNFQFAQDLILYDLPLHPDLVEQRIGRLDRIGQKRTVRIHVPYLRASAEEVRFRWHGEGLSSFAGPVAGGEELLEGHGAVLESLFESFDGARLNSFLGEVRRDAEAFCEAARQNVDVLLDLNSNDRPLGEALASEVAGVDRDPTLQEFLPALLERFGLNEEALDDRGRRRIRPNEMLFVESFPGIPDAAGVVGTYRRELALTREDLEFFSREHPIVEGGLSLLLDEPETHAFAGCWHGAPETNVVFQFLYLLEATGAAWLELGRYLPPTLAEVCIDFRGAVRDELARDIAGVRLEKLSPVLLCDLVGKLGHAIPVLAGRAHQLAEQSVKERRRVALDQATRALRRELERVEELHRVNTRLSPHEVEAARLRLDATCRALESSETRLDAVRVVLLQSPG